MCNCIMRIDANLATQEFDRQRFNDPYFVEFNSYLNGSVIAVVLWYGQVNRKDVFERCGMIRANFCPFCGEKYPFPAPQEEADKELVNDLSGMDGV